MSNFATKLRHCFTRPKPLGKRAEIHAARFLKQKKYKILARNLTCKMGEIDIIARDLDSHAIVIVEVKSASSENPPPEQHLDYRKEQKLIALADYTRRKYKLQDHLIRFDLIAIVWPESEKNPTRITHHINAFQSTR